MTSVELLEFRYEDYKIMYPEKYYQFLKEVYIFDVYRSNFLQENNFVLDLGANIGDFSVLASKKVGNYGKVIAIEPNPDDFEILKMNIKGNNCDNVIPLNLGVGGEVGEKEITFWGEKFRFRMNTLENILNGLQIKDKIDFIKMDIEGFEFDVIKYSIEIIKEANIISLECHSTKERVDLLLLPHGFEFVPVTYGYCYKKMLKNLFLHPIHFYRAALHTLSYNPNLIYKTIRKFDETKENEINGSYIKSKSS